MKRFLLLITCLLAACQPSRNRPATVSEKFAHGTGNIQSFADVEKQAGNIVTVVGTFSHIRGQHGIVTLNSQLRIYLPHFDHFRRNDDWFKYVGKRVRATGRLHTYTKNIPGYEGPSLEVKSFGLLPE